MKDAKDIHVLYIPAWLPTGDNQFGGSFILDQANAVQRHTPARVGFIFRQDLAIRKKHDVLLSYLAPFDHVLVTKPYIPKATSFAIRTWCNQYFHAFRKYIRRFGKPDVIHAHSYVAGFAARHISLESGVPFVLTEHLTTFIDKKVNKAHIGTLKKVLSEADHVIAVSDCLREAIRPYTDRGIHVIPNLFDEHIFQLSDTPQKEAFTIVSVGDLIPRKGFDVLINAFKIALAQDSDLRLEIIGIGPLREKLEAQVMGKNLSHYVAFKGACKPVEVAEVMQASHLCISTSHIETFGITVIEALACGKPVVATPSGGPQNIITLETGILTANWDSNTIAKAILDVKRNEERYKPQRIAEYAVSQYGSKVVADQIFDLYQEVLRK